MHFWGTVELRYSTRALKAQLEVSLFIIWEGFRVGFCKETELESCGSESLFCLVLGESLVGIGVQEVIGEASLFVDVSFKNSRAKVLVCGKYNEVWVTW